METKTDILILVFVLVWIFIVGIWVLWLAEDIFTKAVGFALMSLAIIFGFIEIAVELK